jgi:hypothetical protein
MDYDTRLEIYMASRTLEELRSLRKETKEGDGNGVLVTFQGNTLRVTDELSEEYLRKAELAEAHPRKVISYAREEASPAFVKKSKKPKPSFFASIRNFFTRKI